MAASNAPPVDDRGLPTDFQWAALVPELVVTNLEKSTDFWCRLLGFEIAYSRPRFAYLRNGPAQVMLDERTDDSWIVGQLDRPFGRGLNLQIEIANYEAILDGLAAEGWPLYLAPEEVWYQAGNIETGLYQFIVQDPDGYLVRLQKPLGTRASNGASSG